MSTIGSSLSKADDGTPIINRAVLLQITGVRKQLLRSEFDAAVTAERTRITNNGTGIYQAGEEATIIGESGVRQWFVGSSAAASHWRNVQLPGGLKMVTLGADTNVVTPTSGTPASGVGANGDYAVDATNNAFYGPKASGAWPASSALVPGGTIAATGTVQLSASTYAVNENAGTVTITATRTGGTSGAASAHYATSDGTGAAGTDYTSTSGTLNWADADGASKTFTVPITDRSLTSGTKTFNVALSSPTGVTLGTTTTAAVTIADNDAGGSATSSIEFAFPAGGPPLNIVKTASSGQFYVERGAQNGASGNYTGQAAATISVDSSSTAVQGTDYQAIDLSAVFWDVNVSGLLSRSIVPINNPANTAGKTIVLKLTGPYGAAGTILGTVTSLTVNITPT